jgi:hypothetical protein
MPHEGFEIVLQLFGTSIMPAGSVLRIIFFVQEKRRKGKTVMCFYQGKFGFDFFFYEFRDFKFIMFLCTFREK